MNDRPRTNRCAGADRNERTDRCVRPERRVGGDGGEAIDAPGRQRRPCEQPDGERERDVRLRTAQHGARRRRILGGLQPEDDGGRLRGREQPSVFGIAEEGHIAGRGLFDTGDPPDLDVTAPFQTAPELLGELPQGHRLSTSSAMRRSSASRRFLIDGR
jgi:hypothetical protein